MSDSRFTIYGADNLQKMFRDFPDFGLKPAVNKGFVEASKPVKGAMASMLPSYLKTMTKVIKGKAGKGKNITYITGFWNEGKYINRRGQSWNPYQLLYWHNYGTMANRDPGHDFINPRKPKTSSRKGGIRPKFFVERAWDKSAGWAQKAFEESAEKSIDNFFSQRAFR
jgi:hypothetical protein